MARESRPPDASYYVVGRTVLLSQGDLFRNVPVSYPVLSENLGDIGDGVRRFVSGPLQRSFAVLVTPTCSMRAQGAGGAFRYAHPVRTVVPLLPVSRLMNDGVINASQRGLSASYDDLINYMWLPASTEIGMPDSLALLYMPITMHHDLLMDEAARVMQLTMEGSQQLHRKLAWYATGRRTERAVFNPPMD